ncbi:MAG TPA: hypothetical protein VJX74_07395 [Blastocatellia bacterium]|nr:hypothetical protein [Blastocatellia bacterium]
MQKVSMDILLDGNLDQDPPSQFSAAATCRPFQIIVPPKSEITWDVRLTSLDYPLPLWLTDYTIYIISSHGEDLFQPPTTDDTKKLLDEYEIKWTCQRTVNSALKPGEYVYYISIGPSFLDHEGSVKNHLYKIDPLLVISG